MPKKGKKGGGGKGGATTERLQSLQQRAQTEEEMAKGREETRIQFLKDRLEKEKKNTAENLRKINEVWREILRQTRDPELRQEIITFSQTFERQVEGLESVIVDLTHKLVEKERRSAQGRRAHLQRLERLWDLHNKRMMIVQQCWENGLQSLNFNSDGMQMVAHSKQQQTDLEDAALTLQQQHKDVMDEIHKLYSDRISALEKDIVKNWEETEELEAQMKDRIEAEERLREKEKMERERQALKEELQYLIQKNKDVENRTIEEQLYLKETAEEFKEFEKLQDSIIELREKLKSGQPEKEQPDLKASNNKNKKTLDADARKQLIQLTVQSDSAIKKLQAVIAKGERVVRVAEMCSKLEKKLGKVLTSPPSSSPPPAAAAAASAASAAPPAPAGAAAAAAPGAENERFVTDMVCQEIPEFPELQQLTRRLNTALLVRDDLKKQRKDLSRQNEQLRVQLRRQVADMSVGDHTLNTQHTLLTVSQAPTTAAPPDSTRRRTITKAVSRTASTKKP